MSRVLPNAVVGRAFKTLGIANERLMADLPPMVELGLQKLYGFQHNDGSWGWWYDDSGDDYQTAYVLFGLVATRDAGYAVDEGVIQRGAEWLQARLEHMDRRAAAYALYVLAMAGDAGALPQAQALADEDLAGDEVLDPFSRAALAIALHEAGDGERARALVGRLVAQAEVSQDEARWPTRVADGTYRQKAMASTTRTTALVLDALVRIEPRHYLVPKAVRWLAAQREGGSWGTTQETSYVLLALTDYVLATQEQAAAYEYQVFLNGELLSSGQFERASALSRELELGTDLLQPGQNTLRVVKSGDGRLYARLTGTLYTPQEAIAASGAIGVAREYFDVTTGELLKASDPVHVGQLLRVKLAVDVPKESWYVIVEDYLPAALEGLNERLATTSYVAREYGDEEFNWQRNGYNRKDVFDDRVAFFNTQLMPGTHTYDYLARVTHAGTFFAPPAQVYLMYTPEVWGRSASDELVFAGR